jgi:hypothetical protein
MNFVENFKNPHIILATCLKPILEHTWWTMEGLDYAI